MTAQDAVYAPLPEEFLSAGAFRAPWSASARFERVARLERVAPTRAVAATSLDPEILARLTARPPLTRVLRSDPDVAIMGVLNATPDSFSDGGLYTDAIGDHAQALARQADILDIGGESTRPGADFIPVEEEWRRVAPALEAAAETGVPISIDTRKAEIARRALRLSPNVRMFNDVSALTFDDDSLGVAADYAADGRAVCIMHAQGDPKTMQANPVYDHVVLDVYGYLAQRMVVCAAAGIDRHALIVDPGIGFGKTLTHNVALLTHLAAFAGLGAPLLLGVSRKRFIGVLGGAPNALDRAPGSIAAALYGVQRGARILRVHDVAQTRQAIGVWRGVSEGESHASL